MPELRALATALLTVAAVGVPCAAAAASAASQGADRVDFRFEDARIGESSGLALSSRHPHTVWTVNDSGDSARVFAVDTRTGATVGVHAFDAPVRDVEALAITRQGRMLVADIGDNGASRKVVRIYWFDEPALGRTSGARASWELAYPDGPHDAEALAVDPRSGRVLVVTKDRVGGVYALPDSPSRAGANRLTKVGSAPSTVTDAVFLADGSALAVRTYTSLHLLDPVTFRSLTSTLLPIQPQGETVAVAPGGEGLLVGSEGEGSRVQHVAVPTLPGAPDPTSSAPATPPPVTSAPSVSPTSRSGAGEDDGGLPVNRGELVTGLGASAGLVLLAILVVRLVGRHRR